MNNKEDQDGSFVLFGVKMKYEYNVILRVTACTVLIIGQAHLFIKTSSLSLN